MRRLVLICAALLLAALLTATSVPAHSARPSLRLISTNPLRVSGAHFAPRARIRVTAGWGASLRVRATRRGTFTVRFTGTFIGRCGGGFLIRAAGPTGSSAWLKIPRPACMAVPEPVRSSGSTA